MRPVTFKWKGRDENDFGLIAEDMAKINPLFVFYKNGQVEGVRYQQLTSVLANAIQEQQAQIEEDKKEIAALDHRNADLAAQLATLQHQVSELLSAHAH